jgi:type I restriction enzyme M protein
MPSHTELGEFIWRIADHLRGDYEKNDNEDVILPFTLLRRLDCVLEKTREKVRETETQVTGKVTDEVLKKLLIGAAEVPFYNRSKFSFVELLNDPAPTSFTPPSRGGPVFRAPSAYPLIALTLLFLRP